MAHSKKSPLLVALLAALTQPAFADEFTITGQITSVVAYANGVIQPDYLSDVEYFEATFLYDTSASPAPGGYTDARPHYEQFDIRWHNSMQAAEVALFSSSNELLNSASIYPESEYLSGIYPYARNFSLYVNPDIYGYEAFQSNQFRVIADFNDGTLVYSAEIGVVFSGYTSELILDEYSHPAPPSTELLINSQLGSQLNGRSVLYNMNTGDSIEISYSGFVETVTASEGPVSDSDGDGIPDEDDAFPYDPSETIDSDGDGTGDNSDVFPNDPTETEDSDEDGVGDNADEYDYSDTSETVAISGSDSGVANRSLQNGYTLADTVNAASTTCEISASNHGKYVSCVGTELRKLKKSNLINEQEKELLQGTIANLTLGK